MKMFICTNATRKWMPGLMFALDGVNIYILFAARNNAQQTTGVAHTQLTVLQDEMRRMLTDQDGERLAIVDDQGRLLMSSYGADFPKWKAY